MWISSGGKSRLRTQIRFQILSCNGQLGLKSLIISKFRYRSLSIGIEVTL